VYRQNCPARGREDLSKELDDLLATTPQILGDPGYRSRSRGVALELDSLLQRAVPLTSRRFGQRTRAPRLFPGRFALAPPPEHATISLSLRNQNLPRILASRKQFATVVAVTTYMH
jgi:hypothetical protein